MNDRIKYRYWENEDWHNPNSKLEPVYCNIVDGCDPTIAVSDFEFCTGLKDKNGKLIYEHDIVKTRQHTQNCIVVWFDKDASFSLKSTTSDEYYPIYCYDGFEVIGNIYENKDLL